MGWPMTSRPRWSRWKPSSVPSCASVKSGGARRTSSGTWGVLAHQVQLLADPSAVTGISPLREAFEVYAEECLAHLLVTQEPYWAVTGSLDPTPALRRLLVLKQTRHQRLQEHFDEGTAKRIGPWDDLSLPFAQLQLSFSSGVQATANLWILAWRAAGDRWDIPAGP